MTQVMLTTEPQWGADRWNISYWYILFPENILVAIQTVWHKLRTWTDLTSSRCYPWSGCSGMYCRPGRSHCSFRFRQTERRWDEEALVSVRHMVWLWCYSVSEGIGVCSLGDGKAISYHSWSPGPGETTWTLNWENNNSLLPLSKSQFGGCSVRFGAFAFKCKRIRFLLTQDKGIALYCTGLIQRCL